MDVNILYGKEAEVRLAHSWKKGNILEQLWEQCQDIDDVEQDKLAG